MEKLKSKASWRKIMKVQYVDTYLDTQLSGFSTEKWATKFGQQLQTRCIPI